MLDPDPRTPSPVPFEEVYDGLRAWCRARGYSGHDPFDALNSALFQATPLRRSRAARLAWTQLLKRSPVNLRPLALVPAQKNAKGTALFALAALSRFRAGAEAGAEARALLDDLLAARLEPAGEGGGAAWGYNFDWQGRAFFAPKRTPTVVPTAFAVRALVEAARAFDDRQPAADRKRVDDRRPGEERVGGSRQSGGGGEYLAAARGACDFILRDLRRSAETPEEVCFSYTPLDRTRVFNASLLAAEALATVGALTGERELLDLAERAARYAVRRQRPDGSWPYGEDDYQSWTDNFHTAFMLTSLARVRRAGVGDAARVEIEGAVRRGYEFWRSTFFLADGWPKYYHDRQYPADAHAAGAAVVAFAELAEYDGEATAHAARVARWAVRELRDPRGFFRYQRRRFHTARTPYMRWSQAWMMYALARLLEIESLIH